MVLECIALAVQAGQTAVQTAEALAPVSRAVATPLYETVGAVVLAMGGWKGIAQCIVWIRGSKQSPDDERRLVDEKACEKRHAEDERVRTNEMGLLTKSIDRIDSSIVRLHERLDEVLRGK